MKIGGEHQVLSREHLSCQSYCFTDSKSNDQSSHQQWDDHPNLGYDLGSIIHTFIFFVSERLLFQLSSIKKSPAPRIEHAQRPSGASIAKLFDVSQEV